MHPTSEENLGETEAPLLVSLSSASLVVDVGVHPACSHMGAGEFLAGARPDWMECSEWLQSRSRLVRIRVLRLACFKGGARSRIPFKRIGVRGAQTENRTLW